MEVDEEFSLSSLEKCSYRILQQTAKSLSLPSNVKKSYLIELIYMKKHCSPGEVEHLIRKVRYERKQHALVRKKTTKRKNSIQQQSTEISSTSAVSPPITLTPRRTGRIMIRYSPDFLPVYNRKYRPYTRSDRVLRSFKVKNYVRNVTVKESKEESLNEWSGMETVLKKNAHTSPPLIRKPQRRLSGVYPLNETKPNVSVRRSDGTICKLKAIIQKAVSKSYNTQSLLKNIKTYNDTFQNPRQPQISYLREKLNQDYSIINHQKLLQLPSSEQPINSNYSLLSKNNTCINNNTSSPVITIKPNNQKNSDEYHRNHSKPAIINNNKIISTKNIIHYKNTPQIFKDKTITNRSSGNSIYRQRFITKAYNNEQNTRSNDQSYQITQSINYDERSDPNCSNEISTYYYNNYNRQTDPFNEYESIRPDNRPIYHYQNSGIPFEHERIDNSESDIYYHKKIRADLKNQIRPRNQELPELPKEPKLPRINDVFSKFNMYSRDDKPTYVVVDNEEIAPTHYFYRPDVSSNQTSMLESIYNVKTSFLSPILQVYTTSCSRYVFSSPVATTACVSITPTMSSYKVQPSIAESDAFDFASVQNSTFNMDEEEIPRVHDFFKNFRCDDQETVRCFKQSSSSTMANSEDLSGDVTIPEMVEDAFELISQDGDYMERMGMDIRMQCILCNWAGPKISLEYHIRQEHQSHIIQADEQEWCATYTLSALCTPKWISRIVERDQQLYVLSAKYEDPDCFMATLSIISSDADTPKTGRLTIYNKVTGEPFTWQGDIHQLPPSLPYENTLNCLKLQLSNMDIFPNSANLRLLNRELVVNSTIKVIVGQPELDRIHISLIVKIFDS